MKKSILKLCVFVFLLLSGINGQAQLRQGHIIIDPYYGFPNFGKNVAILSRNALLPIIQEEVPNLSDDIEIGIKGYGPMGGRLEYMAWDRIGFGVDFIYNSTFANFQVDSLNPDGTLFDKFYVDYKMHRIRVHFRANYHFLNKKHIDMYAGIGMGYNTRLHRVETDFLGFHDLSNSFAFAYPYSARIAYGMRVYPQENVGFNFELGLGGPLVSAGISVRFNPLKEENDPIRFD